MTSSIHPSFEHGANFRCGEFAVIGEGVRVGDNVSLGHHCVIESDVVLGNHVKLGHHVVLKPGTRFLDHIDFADYCCTTGISIIGNHVNVRTGACISKSVIVQDWAFIGPGIMSNHTKNVVHGRPHLPHRQYVSNIGYGSVIGSTASLIAGITVGANVILGAGTVAVKDVLEEGIYGGLPARLLKPLPDELRMEVPADYVPHTFDPELLARYLPKIRA